MNILRQNISLKNYSNYKIGGDARYFLEVSNIAELINGLNEWKELSSKNKIFVLGKGTNVLISDVGFDGLVILNKIGGIEVREDRLVIGSGVAMPDVVQFAIDNNLSGLEWAGGLPGTIGAAVRGNAGAFGGETKDSILEVESVDLRNLEVRKRIKEDRDFGYRMSVWKTPKANREMITSVSLQLRKGEMGEIREKTQANIDYRIARHPLEYPNIGSIFKNIPFESLPENLHQEFATFVKQDPFPVVPTAKILVLLNLKGKRIGDAQVSTKHPNFIVNLGNATAAQVKSLINFVKDEVYKAYGIELEEEIMELGVGK